MSNGWFSFGKDSPAVKLARIEFDNGYALNIMSDQLPFTIGRAKDRNLVVTSAFVSRRHCTIDAVDGELHIIDDHLLKHESAAIAHRIHLLFGGKFIVIEPGGSLENLKTGDLIAFTQDSQVVSDILELIISQGHQALEERKAGAIAAPAAADGPTGAIGDPGLEGPSGIFK